MYIPHLGVPCAIVSGVSFKSLTHAQHNHIGPRHAGCDPGERLSVVVAMPAAGGARGVLNFVMLCQL